MKAIKLTVLSLILFILLFLLYGNITSLYLKYNNYSLEKDIYTNYKNISSKNNEIYLNFDKNKERLDTIKEELTSPNAVIEDEYILDQISKVLIFLKADQIEINEMELLGYNEDFIDNDQDGFILKEYILSLNCLGNLKNIISLLKVFDTKSLKINEYKINHEEDNVYTLDLNLSILVVN